MAEVDIVQYTGNGHRGRSFPCAAKTDGALADSSGSMDESDKLPLPKSSLRLLLGAMEPDDRRG